MSLVSNCGFVVLSQNPISLSQPMVKKSKLFVALLVVGLVMPSTLAEAISIGQICQKLGTKSTVQIVKMKVPVICQLVSKKKIWVRTAAARISTTSTTSTTLKVATTVVPIAPLPTSPQFLKLQSGGSATLRRGITYQIYACVNKQGLPFKLEIYLIRTGWSYKAFSTETVDAVRCSTPGYPFQITWVWQVSENIGEVSKLRVTRSGSSTSEMNVVITN